MTAQQKDIKKVIKQLVRDGWSVVIGGKHYRATHPMGGSITIAVSPSCPFAYRNILADIKRLNRSHTPPLNYRNAA